MTNYCIYTLLNLEKGFKDCHEIWYTGIGTRQEPVFAVLKSVISPKNIQLV